MSGFLSTPQLTDAWVILGKRRNEVSEHDIFRARTVAERYRCIDVPDLVSVLSKIVLDSGDEEPEIVRDSNKITLRDELAMRAPWNDWFRQFTDEFRWRYQWADSMLKARDS